MQRLSLTGSIQVSLPLVTEAGRLYWDFLRRYPFLRVDADDNGPVTIRFPGLTLLAFHSPTIVPAGAGWGLRYPIGKGAVVDPHHIDQGYLQMSIEPAQVSLAVEGYYPNLVRLHPAVYEWTQAAIHLHVARGYLPLLAEVARGW